jgi:hypothetical protein
LFRQGSGSDQKGSDPTGSGSATLARPSVKKSLRLWAQCMQTFLKCTKVQIILKIIGFLCETQNCGKHELQNIKLLNAIF